MKRKRSREERDAWRAATDARIAELREHERRIRAEIEERRRASESGDRGSS